MYVVICSGASICYQSTDCPLAFISILAAVFVTMIGIAIQHPGKAVEITVKSDLYHAFLAVSNIVFAYGTFHP